MHLLGYFLDTQNERLITETTKYQQNRTNRVHGLVDQLNELGIELDADDVFDLAKCKPQTPPCGTSTGNTVSAVALTRLFPVSPQGRPVVPKRTSITGKASNSFTRLRLGCHGSSGLKQNRPPDTRLVKAGLDGLECWHTRYPKSTAKRYREMAERYGLIITGGSDCHGAGRGHPLIGTVRVPMRFWRK